MLPFEYSFLNWQNLRIFSHFLSHDIKVMPIKFFVISHLDYYNDLYTLCSQYLLNNLKKY